MQNLGQHIDVVAGIFDGLRALDMPLSEIADFLSNREIERMEEPIRKLEDKQAEAAEHYRRLMNYIEEHKMEIDGFSREITMIDYGLTNDTEKFVTEISIPVRCRMSE